MVQLNLPLKYVTADNEAASLLPECKALEEQKSVRILDKSLYVWLCEVPHPGSMQRKAGKVQQLNRTKLKSVSEI